MVRIGHPVLVAFIAGAGPAVARIGLSGQSNSGNCSVAWDVGEVIGKATLDDHDLTVRWPNFDKLQMLTRQVKRAG